LHLENQIAKPNKIYSPSPENPKLIKLGDEWRGEPDEAARRRRVGLWRNFARYNGFKAVVRFIGELISKNLLKIFKKNKSNIITFTRKSAHHSNAIILIFKKYLHYD
jgi:hypothetical protein